MAVSVGAVGVAVAGEASAEAAVAAVVAARVAVAAGVAAVAVADRRNAMRRKFAKRGVWPAILALAALLPARPAAADTTQRKFAQPRDAVRALVGAAHGHDETALLAILGPGSEDIVSSGDPVADRAALDRFAARAGERTRLQTLDSGAIVVHVGNEDWPLPVPLVKDGDEWRFDTPAGHDELLNRRIGRNELEAIDVCRVFVKAQREYASLQSTEGVRVYAQKIRSEPGTRDGLYWDDPTGKQPSPLGPFLADAEAEGYTKPAAGAPPRPFHGYFYRPLTAQGPHAPGGARSYLHDGKMTGGFALLAYPAEHGSSGVMTFIVGPQGVVYQKTLGEQTEQVAKAITTFDPDDSWTPVRD